MAYAPIPLDGAKVPESIRYFVGNRVEPYLRDVRLMLEFPKVPGEPGFNLTAAASLCGVIGGVSRIFFNATTDDSSSFRATAARYALAEEPWQGIKDPGTFGDYLYAVYRCNLVHSLGLNMEKDPVTRRRVIVDLPARTKVTRYPVLPMLEPMLAELDQAEGWLSGLPSTLSTTDGVTRLCVDSLYCGVRRLVKVLAEDPSLHADAAATLRPWFDALRTPAGRAMDVMSTTRPFYSTAYALDESLGVTSVDSSMWAPESGTHNGS